MARKILLLLATTICLSYAEVEIITEPKPGQEYVFLQTSAAGSRPVERKEKASESGRVFETAHKLPPSLTYVAQQADEEDVKPTKSVKQVKSKSAKIKREASPGEAAAPAPAGAIKLDPLKLIEMYKNKLKTSTTEKPKSTTKRQSRGSKRTKKEAGVEGLIVTSPSPVLTTGAAKPIEADDIPFVAAGSEKQRSRIQIKKGPNGQEYEYEYVYYYYDDDDDKKDKVTNAHDGPAKNEVAQKPARGRGSTAAPEPAANEVLPTSRARTRGRQLEEDIVSEDRLPANTRFPPRSRNLNTTPLPDVDDAQNRRRGRPNDVSTETDSVSDESQGSRGRTRANVRRPSLELVDSASFNTHTSSGEPPSGGPSFPSDLPAGPVRFLGATPNERMDIPADTKNEESAVSVDLKESPATETVAADDVTTMMSPMDKVALDLYAILQGTQRLSGEEEINTEQDSTDSIETTTLEATTEVPTTEATTQSTTTTTTTTTTTPAPTTAEPAFGRGRYRSRGGSARKTSAPSSTETPQDSAKPKSGSKFERPRFGSRPRPGARTTSAPAEEDVQKEEAKTVRPTNQRSRFGGPRTRHTTPTPLSETSSSDDASVAPSRPSLRPRPTFNLRTRTRPTTAASTDAEASPSGEEGEQASTTSRPRARIQASNVRPLRPGPRINLSGGRGRLGAATSTTEAPTDTSPAAEEESAPKTDENEEKEAEPAQPAVDSNPLTRLRNRQRPTLQVRPKAAASAPVQVRRVNPLLARRKPGAAEPTSSEAPQEAPSTEAAAAEEEEQTDAPAASSSTTTEEPRGLNRLLRRRLGGNTRQPGTVA